MVMYFKSEKALKCLLEKGIVYTLREQRRKRTGNDWIKTSRKGEKIADVFVEEIGLIKLETIGHEFSMMKKVIEYTDLSQLELEPYVQHSGFSNVKEWVEEYWKLAGWRAPYAWLYKVTLREKMKGIDTII